MKLLFITRKADDRDSRASFVVPWMRGLAERVEHLDVICVERGRVISWPANAGLYSVGKELGYGKIHKLWIWKRLATRLVQRNDVIFCHMMPEYVIAIWPWAWWYKKPIVFWYTHGTVSWRLRLAEKMATTIFTASSDSFRLPSAKVVVTGHGIDTDLFQPSSKVGWGEPLVLLTTGRLSVSKRLELMVDALAALRQQGVNAVLQIIGSPARPGDEAYVTQIKQQINDSRLTTYVSWLPGCPQSELVTRYQQADFYLNFSQTNSLDKGVLEAMACGLIPLTSNPAFQKIVPNRCVAGSPTEAAATITQILAEDSVAVGQWRQELRGIVERDHALPRLLDLFLSKIKP